MHVEGSRVTPGTAAARVFHDDRPALLLRLLDDRPQLDGSIGQLQVMKGPSDIGWDNPEKSAGPVVEHRQLAGRIQHDLGQRGRFERGLRDERLSRHGICPLNVSRKRRGGSLGPGFARYFPKDSAPRIDGSEERRVRHQHLGLAEKQKAAIGEREMEPREDARLDLRVEIHQRVAADDQRHPRDGRVLNQIVAPEDHGPSQLLIEDVVIAFPVSVLVREACGGTVLACSVVRSVPGLRQRLVVHVGGVYLHPLTKGVNAELLGQEHGDRVRLFAGGAAGRPHPNRRRWAARLENCRISVRRYPTAPRREKMP